ncbi:metal-sulfur cluster assembly factor [Maridesulfovibrio sp.]|uniref:metal-sulfur cluster assembly factor n=1 Tax=Maridesulfovibrio sp. TaxID=2795000 RepID=UPI002AA66D24|nr:metal-sulfur cluster assembly factor [Maridesulfovibrio sp.]
MSRIFRVSVFVMLLLVALAAVRQGATLLYSLRIGQKPVQPTATVNSTTNEAQSLLRINDELANRRTEACLSSANFSPVPELSYAKGSPEQRILEKLKQVVDPELDVNVVDLGLIKGISVSKDLIVVNMIITTPTCPFMEVIVAEIKQQAGATCPGCNVTVLIDLDTRWTPADMTAQGNRLLLGED